MIRIWGIVKGSNYMSETNKLKKRRRHKIFLKRKVVSTRTLNTKY